MSIKKDVTPAEADKFWELFNEKHPEIDAKLPPTRALINGSIFCNKPATMSEDEYNIFFKFLRKWYMDNGFINREPVSITVITADQKMATIISDSIMEIEPIDAFSTKVKYRESLDTVTEVVVNENSEVFKHRLNI